MAVYPVNTAKNMRYILKELLGQELGVDSGGYLIGENLNGIALRNQKYSLLADVYGKSGQYDDFMGYQLSNQWQGKTGSDGGVVGPVATASENGIVRMTTGAGVGATMAVNGVSILGSLNYQAQRGRLTFEAYTRISAITSICWFVGFTNAVTLQMPIQGSGTGNGVTGNAADAVGILFDTAMTTQNFWGVGNAASTTPAPINLGVAPVATTYVKLRVEVDLNGLATFYINDLLVGSQMNAAVTNTVNLSPVICAFRRSAASANVDMDYIYAIKNRS